MEPTQHKENGRDADAWIAALEVELALARRQLADAQQVARIGSWEWDIPNDVVWWSDELYRIYGLRPQEIVPSYERFLHYLHPEDRDSVDERNRKAFADHEPFEDVKRVVRADDGREILMRTQGEVISDADGQPMRMVGVSRTSPTRSTRGRPRASAPRPRHCAAGPTRSTTRSSNG